MELLHVMICLIAAGYCKGKLDYLADNGEKGKEWKNKYKQVNNELQPTKKQWWYFGVYKSKYQEKFPFSTTVLVFLTDRWHWWQFAMLRYFYLAISHGITDNFTHQLILTFIVFPVVLGIPFELTYKSKK